MKDTFSFVLVYWHQLKDTLPMDANVLLVIIIGIVLLAVFFIMKALVASPKGKNKKTSRAIKKHAQSLIDAGSLPEAGEIYLAEGELMKAFNLFVDAEAFDRAAHTCELQGQHQRAGEFYVKARRYNEAIEAFKRAQKYDQAAEYLVREGRASEAGKMYESVGLLSQSAQVYARDQQYLESAKLYNRIEEYHKAGSMYGKELTKQIRSIRGTVSPERWKNICDIAREGAQVYIKANDLEKAADLYVKGEFFSEAANLHRELGDLNKAADTLIKGKRYMEAAEMYKEANNPKEAHRVQGLHFKKEGMKLEAAQNLTEGESFLEAAELWVELDEKQMAAQCYEKAGEYAEAAGYYSFIKDHKNAASCYEKAHAFEDAASQYGALSDVSKQGELLMRAKRYLKAGDLYMNKGALDKAITAFQEIPETSQDFRKAANHLGKIFFEKGMFGVALKKYQQAIADQSTSVNNLEQFYHMGIIHERMGNLKDASAVYEQILATNYEYEDVATRLGNIQLELSRQRDTSKKTAELYETTKMVPKGNIEAIDDQTANPERFEPVDEIGRGGMGIVYKARDRILNRIVALKYLPANFAKNSLAIRNFQREAQSTAQLNHPGIVTVFDVGYDSRGNYIAMEYLEGETVKEKIRRVGALPFEDVIEVSKQLSDALSYAHRNKIIHRDIKTSNMMLCKGGVVKIMDFGLAKIMQDAQNSTTQISGTPYYMSPEQTLGRDLDHRTDIYSFGICLYEMTAGVVPFKEGDIGYHQIHTPAPDPKLKNPNVPDPLRAIIWKCMEKNPDERYQQALDLTKDLDNLNS